MKKGIILLISLLFIGALSLLILKNINQSEKLITYTNTNSSLSQIQISIENINDEILNLFTKSGMKVEEIFEFIPESLPLHYGNIQANISLELMDSLSYYSLDVNTTSRMSELDLSYIIDQYAFNEQIVKKNPKTKQQIEYLIESYAKYVKDKRIFEIKDKFISFDMNTSSTYIKADYSVQVNSVIAQVEMVLDIDKKEKII